MSRRILITGGAGFIGSHLTDALIARGDRVRILDNLCPQVHGEGRQPPDYLHPSAELIVGDVRDRETVDAALTDIDAVVHLAAAVGVGQSMYRIEHYASTNDVGTAVLLEALAERSVGRLVVASSMSIYGEGLYRDEDGGLRAGHERSREQLAAGQWELMDQAQRPLVPVPTPEDKQPALASVYALTKYDQERLCLVVGAAYGIPTTALRFFNVYGTRQALSNPYTGVLAIFASRLLNGRPPLIYEDGLQQRDFVSVHDVVQAIYLALDEPRGAGKVFNIARGQPRTVLDVADLLAGVLGRRDLRPTVTGRYRVGDIRHCIADIGLAQKFLCYAPRVRLEDGLVELAQWLRGQAAHDGVDRADAELVERGLTL